MKLTDLSGYIKMQIFIIGDGVRHNRREADDSYQRNGVSSLVGVYFFTPLQVERKRERDERF